MATEAIGQALRRLSPRRPDDSNPRSISHRLRKRRFAWIEETLHQLIAEKGEVRVLDVGGRARYWKLLDPSFYPNLHVTILNVEGETGTPADAPEGLAVELRVGDACNMPEFADDSFDFCHSNSVIEHVGSLHNMVRFAAETRRVAAAFYHQTPNLWFPIDPHFGVPFIHWLPKSVRAILLLRYKLGYSSRSPDFSRAASRADHTEIVNPAFMRALFPGAEMLKERIFYVFCKSIAVRGRRR